MHGTCKISLEKKRRCYILTIFDNVILTNVNFIYQPSPSLALDASIYVCTMVRRHGLIRMGDGREAKAEAEGVA
jgi:hypothetical protein